MKYLVQGLLMSLAFGPIMPAHSEDKVLTQEEMEIIDNLEFYMMMDYLEDKSKKEGPSSQTQMPTPTPKEAI